MNNEATAEESICHQSRFLLQSDALVLVERLPSAEADLVFIDAEWPHPKKEPHRNDSNSESRMHKEMEYIARVLQQCRRALSDSGSVLLYSTPYLNGNYRLLLDQVFGRKNFRTEIVISKENRIWPKDIGPTHETLLWYSKSENYIHNQQTSPLTEKEMLAQFRYRDERGRFRRVALTGPCITERFSFSWHGITPEHSRGWRFTEEKLHSLWSAGLIEIVEKGPQKKAYLKHYLSDSPGREIGTIWGEKGSSKSSQLYPGQMPEWIIERVILMSTNEGSIVVDPFCGSGTTPTVAERLGRRWIAGDIASNAITVCKERLFSEAHLQQGHDYSFGSQDWLTADPRVQPDYPPIVTGFDLEKIVKRGQTELVPEPKFELGQKLELEETRCCEFKEIKGDSPLRSIANAADEYAVAFLNSEGGRIIWGVRDSDHCVVGVPLLKTEHDVLRKYVINKLNTIKPQIDPTQFQFLIHQLNRNTEKGVPLVVVELVIPRPTGLPDPYYTGGDEAFVRVDGAKQRLSGPQLTDWIRRRLNNSDSGSLS